MDGFIKNEVVVEALPCAEWLTPEVVVSAIGLLLASVVVPLLLHYLKGRRDEKSKILEVRTKIYAEYFKTFEEAAKGVGQDYEKFSKVTLRSAFIKLLEAGNSPQALAEFQDVVGDFPHNIQDSHRKVTEQTTILKILGSKKLYELTKEFETLNQEILEMSSDWLAETQKSLTSPDFETPVAIEMKDKGRKIRSLKDEIIDQMRAEINHD